MRTVWRRKAVVPIAAVMANRGEGLLRQPFTGLHVPTVFAVLFLAGAATLIVLMVWPAPWRPWTTALAATATGGPYIMYVFVWGLEAIPLSTFRVTAGDLILVPYLISLSWGRLTLSWGRLTPPNARPK